MKRVLMLASVASMIDQFNMHNITLLQQIGFTVDVACNFEKGSTCSKERIEDLKHRLNDMGVAYYQINFTRSVMNLKQDYIAYKQVKRILKQSKYEFIHCHSPIGGVIGRLSGHATKTKVIYTAHGFHFFKGAPLKNWLIYYPIELICSFFTDVLITINKEDYARAQKRLFAKKVEYVPGVGIDIGRFANSTEEHQIYRKSILDELGISESAKLILSVGELNDNKNHQVIIKALANMKNNEDVHYLIAGKGNLADDLVMIANELGLGDRLHLVGFRTDIPNLLKGVDVFAFPSKREGLPVSLMEAMAAGLPIVCSKIRGNTDLIVDEENGFLCDMTDVKAFEEAIGRALDLKKNDMLFDVVERAKLYSTEKIAEKMRRIYFDV